MAETISIRSYKISPHLVFDSIEDMMSHRVEDGRYYLVQNVRGMVFYLDSGRWWAKPVFVVRDKIALKCGMGNAGVDIETHSLMYELDDETFLSHMAHIKIEDTPIGWIVKDSPDKDIENAEIP